MQRYQTCSYWKQLSRSISKGNSYTLGERVDVYEYTFVDKGLTNESMGVFQADASRASVVQLSSGPINAFTFFSLISVINLQLIRWGTRGFFTTITKNKSRG